jgi:hypothetical protein
MKLASIISSADKNIQVAAIKSSSKDMQALASMVAHSLKDD